MKPPYLLELIAVGVFAVSGTLAAGRKSLDLVGVYVIAVVTAVGGGTLRDVLLDRHPLFWVTDPSYLYAVTVAVFLTLAYVRFRPPPQQVLLIADAIGLSVFSIVGAQFAEDLGRPWLVAVVMGTLTGTAGGVLRDMLCNDIPILFREGYLYATAAAVGAMLYVLAESSLGREMAAYLGMIVVAGLRLGSIIYKWNLPRFNLDDGRRLERSLVMRPTITIFAVLAALPAFAAEPNHSTPVATVRSYLAASKANDVEAAKLCWGIDDDNASGALDVVVGMRIASRKLVRATEAKFGSAGVKLLGRWDQPGATDKAIDRTIERLGNINGRELGDVARLSITWEPSDGDTTPVFLPTKAPLYFRKYGTEWKIDANVFTGEKRAADLFGPTSPWTIWRDEMAVMIELTRLIEKGDVKEIGEFERELNERVVKLKVKYQPKE